MDIHRLALERFDRIQSSYGEERKLCAQDRRFTFVTGGQWEGPLGDQFENKPMLEVNKVHLSVMRIISEMRNNRITVNFVSKDGEESDLADTCNALYRADEQDSVAQEAYDNSFEEACSGGFGAFRLRACYENDEDDEDERQRIRFEPITDADTSVFFDPAAKRQDKSDAKYAFVIHSVQRVDYEDEWGDDVSSWPEWLKEVEWDWNSPDVVYVAEYYVVEETKETQRIFRTIDGDEEKYTDIDEELEAELRAAGSVEIRQRQIKRKRVRKYLLSGGKILEDCGYIAGKRIPIVPVYGKRWFIDNVERCMGQARLAKDSQRLKNLQISQLALIASLSSQSKPLLFPEQVAGHTTMWADDASKNYPYLLINKMEGPNGEPIPSGPVAYTQPAQVPQAMAALLQITEQDMSDVLGNTQPEELISNISEKTMEIQQNRMDMRAFIYMSNFAKALQTAGEIWLGMAKELYVEPGRKMKGVGTEDQISSIEIARPVYGETGEELENDLTAADFDVVVDVGPSFTSKRDAMVSKLISMMQFTQDPQDMAVLLSTAIMNIDGEGLKPIREHFRKKLVALGVAEPTEEERQAMENQEPVPDPNAIFLQNAAMKEAAQAEKLQADARLSEAKVGETVAKTTEILAGLGAEPLPA